VEVLGLDRHYERSLVDAEHGENGYTIKTANVRALHLTLPAGAASPVAVRIDGQTLSLPSWLSPDGTQHLYLERQDAQWTRVLPEKLVTDRLRRPQKMARSQGPIDDAFMESFLCVRGTGTAWNESAQKYAEESLRRFEREWDKYFRGQLVIKEDFDVRSEEIARHHLILFGDPGSNTLIAQVLNSLPLEWSRKEIRLGDKTFAAAEHVPALIYPSPLNASRYIVLNSGHTFHAVDFQRTNAYLYPRLGDYAIVKPAPTEKDPAGAHVIASGLFDELWRLSNDAERKARSVR
jgi:hypothetical protein